MTTWAIAVKVGGWISDNQRIQIITALVQAFLKAICFITI